ncbi:calcium/calmodulin-dependent protein kinase kinase 1-like isoform x8 [Plakobranchus ocellatus]|uniref:Calcium/calmodulin-dependent protein kinase kinase 1-like isoform x8 n=1 Tax=Plakobranchus ocellatus TaxID=259542 RepID=A0AAV3ZED8_9GAST|nr:calcium/calmodulin-dependent protein kinase kinase 1-like isoform x8 [Plakobranchus ocellatus]
MVVTHTSPASSPTLSPDTAHSSGLSGYLHKATTSNSSKSMVHREKQQHQHYHRKNAQNSQQYAGGVEPTRTAVVNNKVSSSASSSLSHPSRRPASSPSLGHHRASDTSSGILSSSTATSYSRTIHHRQSDYDHNKSQHVGRVQHHGSNNNADATTAAATTTTTNSNNNINNLCNHNLNEEHTRNHCDLRNQLQRSNSERPSPFSHRPEEEVSLSPKLQHVLPYQKYPLTRKISNITVDSGRSSTSGTDDCIFDEEDEDFVDTAGTNRGSALTSAADTVTSRRHSIACVDSTGHLDVPSYPGLDHISPLIVGAAPTTATSQRHHHHHYRNSSSPDGANPSYPTDDHEYNVVLSPPSGSPSGASPNSTSTPVSVLSVKRAPKIVYSHSEDRLTASCNGQQRPIIPSLPYSPYGSPTASPRLRRQPTMETHRVSVSEGTGSYTQLNQYTLQDEIGKVSV